MTMFTDDELEVVEEGLRAMVDLYYDMGDEEKMLTAEDALEKVRDR